MPYLEMRGITKIFPGVVANDRVTLTVEQGEIHALVGENGAGKTTLMRILYGMYRPDAGEIFLRGRRVEIPNPQAAIALGIGMVHQHFQLVPSLTVAENVELGRESRRFFLVDREQAIARVGALARRFGLAVDPTARVADLSVGVQQRVEILKLLYREADLLILDEPTAVLTPQETQELFQVLRRLRDEGRTLLFITHKLGEVLALSDRVTVLRRGRVTGVLETDRTNEEELARLMVGREVKVARRLQAASLGEPALRVEGLVVRDERGLTAVNNLSFTVHRGEIVGIAGVEGNGQRELLEALAGIRPLVQGRIWLDGREIHHLPVRMRREAGLGLIPEDRTQEGLNLLASIEENLAAVHYYRPPLSQRGLLHPAAISGFARKLISLFDIRVTSPTAPAAVLSGGNQQRVVVARELAADPSLLIAAHPTRGLDVGATQAVRRELLRLRDRGLGVLLISADLDEILALADRILVLFRGQVVGEVPAEQATQEMLGLMMAGHRPETLQADQEAR